MQTLRIFDFAKLSSASTDAKGNLACGARFLATEETLLDHCESNDHPGFLSFWESTTYFAVLGYGKQLSAEVFEEECARRDIPILRRSSGGGTVLQGPGCLNYTLVLPIEADRALESITGANRFIMRKTRSALAPLISGEVSVDGHTDLTLNGLKFSGNAQRRKRRCILFHGSFLIDFNLGLIAQTLRPPPQQPEYRRHRPHLEFITNLNLDRNRIITALKNAWNATAPAESSGVSDVLARSAALLESKYSRDEWNRRF